MPAACCACRYGGSDLGFEFLALLGKGRRRGRVARQKHGLARGDVHGDAPAKLRRGDGSGGACGDGLAPWEGLDGYEDPDGAHAWGDGVVHIRRDDPSRSSDSRSSVVVEGGPFNLKTWLPHYTSCTGI